jgi:hypothetical protein
MQRRGEMCKILQRAQHKRNQSASTGADEASADKAELSRFILASHLHLASSEVQGMLGLARGAIEYGCVLRGNPNNLADELR